jgi:dihydrofolate synthase / folylpolyglutamate synthase
MNYQETLKYIMKQLPMYQRIGKLAYRTGLDNTLLLDAYFNKPHQHFKTIHIAGTNGKGSVSHMIASILQESGYKTGLYTSPHLVDFRERIRINGKMISKKFVSHFINDHKSYFESFDPSFFEISVFMAFQYFLYHQVDIAVIEVGLGGRLDATNIIKPVLSVITNIGRDHTEILGETHEKIAIEKAGIIKENIPVIIGESQPETLPVFREFCTRHHAPMIIADTVYQLEHQLMPGNELQVFDVKYEGTSRYPHLECGLLGHYQRKNIATVLAATDQLKQLNETIPDNAIYKGLKNVIANTGLAGRWQIIQHKPALVCDTAHNSDGIREVMEQIKDSRFKNLHLVTGFVNDKDVDEILQLMPGNARYYFVRLSVPRTMDEKLLQIKACRYGLTGESFPNIKAAFEIIKKEADPLDLIVVTGSNFLVADFLAMNSLSHHL